MLFQTHPSICKYVLLLILHDNNEQNDDSTKVLPLLMVIHIMYEAVIMYTLHACANDNIWVRISTHINMSLFWNFN